MVDIIYGMTFGQGKKSDKAPLTWKRIIIILNLIFLLGTNVRVPVDFESIRFLSYSFLCAECRDR